MKPKFYQKSPYKVKNTYRKMFYRWIIRKFLKDCRSILDVGCGKGIFFDCALNMSKDAFGLDNEEIYKREGITLMDYKKINTHYDCFFNSQFIEHVNQFDFMGIAAKYCDKKIITITPRPSNSFWDDPLHIRPYTIKAIKKLYKAYGFKPIFSLSLFPTKSFIVIGEKVKNV